MADLSRTVSLDISGDDIPNRMTSDSWKQCSLPVEQPVETQPGDRIALTFARTYPRHRDTPFRQSYRWEGEILRGTRVLGRFCQDKQFRVVVQQFAVDGLTEAQSFLPIIARLPIQAQMPMMRVFIDEFGCGNYEQTHSRLYVELLAEMGLPQNLSAYLQGVNDESYAQCVGAGVLRGAGETRFTFLANILGHYGVGPPVALLLAFGLDMGVVGLWWGLCAGLSAVALVLFLRLLHISSGTLEPLSQPGRA